MTLASIARDSPSSESKRSKSSRSRATIVNRTEEPMSVQNVDYSILKQSGMYCKPTFFFDVRYRFPNLNSVDVSQNAKRLKHIRSYVALHRISSMGSTNILLMRCLSLEMLFSTLILTTAREMDQFKDFMPKLRASLVWKEQWLMQWK